MIASTFSSSNQRRMIADPMSTLSWKSAVTVSTGLPRTFSPKSSIAILAASVDPVPELEAAGPLTSDMMPILTPRPPSSADAPDAAAKIHATARTRASATVMRFPPVIFRTSFSLIIFPDSRFINVILRVVHQMHSAAGARFLRSSRNGACHRHADDPRRNGPLIEDFHLVRSCSRLCGEGGNPGPDFMRSPSGFLRHVVVGIAVEGL